MQTEYCNSEAVGALSRCPAGEDVCIIIIFRLPEGWEVLGSLVVPSPAVKEVERQRGEWADDRIDISHAAHILHLAVLVLLTLSHRHEHAGHGLAWLRPLVLQANKNKVGNLDIASTLTPSDGDVTYKRKS